jgi:hypothetical protein
MGGTDRMWDLFSPSPVADFKRLVVSLIIALVVAFLALADNDE